MLVWYFCDSQHSAVGGQDTGEGESWAIQQCSVVLQFRCYLRAAVQLLGQGQLHTQQKNLYGEREHIKNGSRNKENM